MQKSPYQIILRPVITEKTQKVAARDIQFVFEVAVTANKREIKWAVETAYGVKVEKINTALTKGELRRSRVRGGLVGKTRDVKKAYVTLAEGQTIETQ